MIEINCHMCGESYSAHILLGRGETRMQPEECAKCGEDTHASILAAVRKDLAKDAADGQRRRDNE
jgi:uncharacterized Zn finger protein